MPYVLCASCGLTTYSAALRAAYDDCPRCGTRLPTRRERAGAASPAERDDHVATVTHIRGAGRTEPERRRRFS